MGTNIDLSGLQVLVVDDEDFYRSLIVRLLNSLGIADITEAADGAAGLQALEGGRPDLVILDVMMEPMNGLKFLKAVRMGMSSAARDLPIIILTGSSDEAVMGASLALDCDAFVQKTDGRDVIEDRIVRVTSTTHEVKEAPDYQLVRLPEVAVPAASGEAANTGGQSSAKGHDVPVYEVEPGAVLDSDLLTPEGHLLLAAGTRLAARDIDRLCDISEIVDLPDLRIRTKTFHEENRR